ncbi:MAG: FAD-binding protein [Oscillospiraceae bacterium]|jgi:succinate dehydrogenase/fumarate reductase flavoprotein subunit|nr:FAD-binding protein [Oscillospiraceae bacterium]
MRAKTVECGNLTVDCRTYDTIVIGSGCAGFNAADWLHQYNRRDIALVTEGINMGTSRNTGSDKQTYYKLSLASDGADSVREMAQTLFEGGGVNGDNALVEAALSVRSFIKLSLLGVPFPENEYGEFVGYKTDHDPRQRATSAGPLTSKYMTEALERSVRANGTDILDGYEVFRLLVSGGRVYGFLAFNLAEPQNGSFGITAFFANHVVWATGGSAAVYLNSVYPESQRGTLGPALEAGALCCNLNEWQYGLASTKFRWNVSGTYQQVLPRYISVDERGKTREFLREYFEDDAELLDLVFLKGYQWPFDSGKIKRSAPQVTGGQPEDRPKGPHMVLPERINGSSQIDLLVHREMLEKGRRVFLDFTADPRGLENGFDCLSRETRKYLENSGALVPTPIRRLEIMNPQAIRLYQNNGIDLTREPLEIAVCAQHQNGGLDVDANWETSVKGLYAVGEAAGTFGVYRPGGSALNSTQAGSLRAAQHIAFGQKTTPPEIERAFETWKDEIRGALREINRFFQPESAPDDAGEFVRLAGAVMSDKAAHIRDSEQLTEAKEEIGGLLGRLECEYKTGDPGGVPGYFRARGTLQTALAALSAMNEAVSLCGSRGSAFVPGSEPLEERHANIQFITRLTGASFETQIRKVREIPEGGQWFEAVWREYNRRFL